MSRSKGQRRRRSQRRRQPPAVATAPVRRRLTRRALAARTALVAGCLLLWALAIIIPASFGVVWLAATLGAVVPIVETLVWGAIHRRRHPEEKPQRDPTRWDSDWSLGPPPTL